MSKTQILIIISMILFWLIVGLSRMYTRRRVKTLFEEGRLEQYQAFLDTFWAKTYIRPYERELSKLTGYLASMDDKNTEKQLRFMLEEINTTAKQKAEIASRGFYHYLSKEKYSEAGRMLQIIEDSGIDVPDRASMTMLYEIFGKKSDRYIDTLKKNIEVLLKQDDEDGHYRQNIGIYEYLIAVQYRNRKDIPSMKRYLNAALEKCRNTPYEMKIR
ncbi:MAG: hypothetical protein IIZ47_07335, partial [Erysipelotrichaceae bacterium]|nr:hypothetical protein [Erysipelotrichaceae bacterium]